MLSLIIFHSISFTPLYADVVESHLLKNEIAVILNVFLHGVNSITCLIDIFISARPWKVFHFVYPIIFGFYYAGFSLIFWGGGGVGVCYNTKTTPENHPTATVHFPDSNEWCDPFIYPILDWQNNPLIAIGVILGGCLVIPLIHFFWMGLIWIREYIASKTISENTQSDLPTNIDR